MIPLKKLNKEEFGKLVMPEKIFSIKLKEELSDLVEKVYFDNLNYLKIANIFFLSQILSFLIFIIFLESFLNFQFLFIDIPALLDSSFIWKYLAIFGELFILSILVYYLILFGYLFTISSKYKKTQDELEKDLPEFIDALVSNIKGGISLERGMIKSVRPEQKALLQEITLINEKILMGKTTLQAIDEFKGRYEQSEVLSRTIFLIEEGIKGGGNLAAPLERISENLKKIYLLNDEIKGSAGGFAIVIQAISILIAPILFALAITILSFISDLMGLLAEGEVSFFSGGAIPAEFNQYLIYFSYWMIILIVFFSSLITSSLKNEKAYEAIRYLPIYVLVSILIYKFASAALLGFFSGIVG